MSNAGEFPDWVELHNTTDGNVDLVDWSLSDEPTLPRRFVFPSGSTWIKVADVTATTTADQCVDTTLSTTVSGRFFRVVTPAQP